MQFNSVKVLIIGDVMIDSYLWGKVDRISPEAPVPVVNVQKREKRLGGAANVALNVQSLGATPVLCSVIGTDTDGEEFVKLLDQGNLSTEGIIKSETRITTIKHRIIAGSQQMLRVDSETDVQISGEEELLLIEKTKELMLSCHVVIFEDYDKGVLGKNSIKNIIDFANQNNIPTVVDPKKRNFLFYENATLFKPNLKELKEGLKLDFEGDLITNVTKGIDKLKEQLKVKSSFVTLSEHGVLISDGVDYYHIPAHKREIADVSGAGDTVISVAALCVALGMNLKSVAQLSNLAGGIVCEHIGVVPIELEVLMSEVKRLNMNLA